MVLTHFPSHLKNVSDNRAVKYAFSCYSYVFFLSFNHLDVGEIAKMFVLQTKIIRNFRDHKKQ